MLAECKSVCLRNSAAHKRIRNLSAMPKKKKKSLVHNSLRKSTQDGGVIFVFVLFFF